MMTTKQILILFGVALWIFTGLVIWTVSEHIDNEKTRAESSLESIMRGYNSNHTDKWELICLNWTVTSEKLGVYNINIVEKSNDSDDTCKILCTHTLYHTSMTLEELQENCSLYCNPESTTDGIVEYYNKTVCQQWVKSYKE